MSSEEQPIQNLELFNILKKQYEPISGKKKTQKRIAKKSGPRKVTYNDRKIIKKFVERVRKENNERLSKKPVKMNERMEKLMHGSQAPSEIIENDASELYSQPKIS